MAHDTGTADAPALVIGHRGASGYRPEHTAAAYELALALGADAVEPDLVVTRDGELVIRHENEISGTTDVAEHPEFAGRRRTTLVDGVERTGWFTEDFTWAELSTLRCRERLGSLRPLSSSFDGRYRMLRLGDLLDLLERAGEGRRHPPGLVVELKHPTYFDSIGLPLTELVASELRDRGFDRSRLTVECFEVSALQSIRARGVTADLVYLIEAEGAPFDRVARDGLAAVGYDRDVTGTGLADLAAMRDTASADAGSVDTALLAGVSVHAGLLAHRDEAGRVRGASGLVGDAHAAGLGVYCWTLRAENRFLAPEFRRGDSDACIGDWRGQFEWIFGTGVDGVFADQPDLAVCARDGR